MFLLFPLFETGNEKVNYKELMFVMTKTKKLKDLVSGFCRSLKKKNQDNKNLIRGITSPWLTGESSKSSVKSIWKRIQPKTTNQDINKAYMAL